MTAQELEVLAADVTDLAAVLHVLYRAGDDDDTRRTLRMAARRAEEIAAKLEGEAVRAYERLAEVGA